MRDYSDVEIEIENTYKKGRATQTLEFVTKMHQKYLLFDTSINIHSIFNKINEFVDKSDPDIIYQIIIMLYKQLRASVQMVILNGFNLLV